MKKQIIDSTKELIKDRYLLILLSSLVLMSVIFAVIIALSIHPSELQLVTRYSPFGVTHYYRDQWYYLVTFVLFELAIAVIHTVLSIKLLVAKDRLTALLFGWLGAAVVFMGFVVALAVINAWIP